MTQELQTRLETLRHDLDHSAGAAHEAHLDHLEQVVQALRTMGEEVPHWAQDRLSGRSDEAAEDGFDNMPL
ncbi:hypothetical protein ACN2XU_06930 [Primorskyibacter sp. 2E107]|uniref:hypothetical protein n=1 Tax=Primorskyibacter sp. 2E107 TaxID=3403458 RepID=UPI003AF487B5